MKLPSRPGLPWRRKPATICDLEEPPDGSAFIRFSAMGRVISFLLRDDDGAADEGYPPGSVWFEYVSSGDLPDEAPTTWLLLCKDVHEDDDTLEPLVRTTPQPVHLSF